MGALGTHNLTLLLLFPFWLYWLSTCMFASKSFSACEAASAFCNSYCCTTVSTTGTDKAISCGPPCHLLLRADGRLYPAACEERGGASIPAGCEKTGGASTPPGCVSQAAKHPGSQSSAKQSAISHQPSLRRAPSKVKAKPRPRIVFTKGALDNEDWP